MTGVARGTGIVGSVTVELERKYRVALLKIANELTTDDCEQIAFLVNLPKPTCVPEQGKSAVRLHLMSTLESYGHIGPLKLEFLEEALDTIGQKKLLEIIDIYKKGPMYREAKIRMDDQERIMRKKRVGKKTKLPNQSDLQLLSSEVRDQLTDALASERLRKFQDIYATLLTQFSQMAILMRSAIESRDLSQMEDTFLSVASDGDAITRTLRKNLETAGIRCSGDSSSSNSPVHSPTEEMSVPVFNPSASLQATDYLHSAVMSQTHEASLNPTTHRKKPIPLPRKRGPLLQDSHQVSSPTSPAATKLVYCQQETQCPSSMLTANALGIPHSASTSCLTHSLEYSGDYSGGTGDSGVGDIRQKYIPAKKSLDELDPTKQHRENEHGETHLDRGNEQPHYMPLKMFEKTTPDGYTKPIRAKSLDDFLQLKDSYS